MTFPQIIDVVLGLSLIYLLLSSLSTLISQLIMENLQAKGRALERYLRVIAGNKTPDLLDMPQIRSLRPIRLRTFLDVFSATLEPKKVEKIPVDVLVDSFFELMNFPNKSRKNVRELKKLVNNMPESESKKALLNWIQQGITTIDQLRAKITIYFSGLLAQAEETAIAYARSFVITLSIGIVILLQVDSIQLAKNLAKNADIRNVSLAKVNAILDQKGADTEMSTLMKEFGNQNLTFGWYSTNPLPITNTIQESLLFIFFKLLGLAITAAAVSQGSAFWFEILNKLK